MRKSQVLVLTLVLSLCIGLAATSASPVAWIDWTPGTPPTNNSISPSSGVAWIDWTPGTPPTNNSIILDSGVAWIDWTPGTPPVSNIIGKF